MSQQLKDFLEKFDHAYAEDPQAVVSACGEHIRLFGLRYFRHYIKYDFSEFHIWLNDTFDRETKSSKGCKWAIAAPRGNAKSGWATLIFPLWCILFKRKNFIIIISDTASQACDFLTEIKQELLTNEYILKDFPEICSKTDKWRGDEIITANSVRVVALGSQNKILGRRHGAYRPDLVISDDLENQDSVSSQLMRERMWQWFTKEVLKCGAIDGSTDFYVVGTIKHQDSLLSKLLDPTVSPGWRGKIFRAVKSFADNNELWQQWSDVYTDRDLGDERFNKAHDFYVGNELEMLKGTEVLWPDGEPYIRLMEIKQEGDISFSSEKMNQPIDRTKCLIEPDEIRYYEDIDLEDRNLVVFGALDPATGKGVNYDFACIVTAGKCRRSGKIFILDAWLGKVPIEKQVQMVISKHKRFDYYKFFVEENAFQVVIKDHLQKISRLTQDHIPIYGITQGGNQKKELRIEWSIPFLKDGTVFFHKSQKTMIEQICNFTPDGSGGMNDDGPDALAMILKQMLSKRFRMITR